MIIDKAKFFKLVPIVTCKTSQVVGTESILDQWFQSAPSRGEATASGDIRHLAYILATAYHETAGTMEPIREYGRGRGRAYGTATGPYEQAYYGRGYVQLTWLDNYIRATKELKKRGLLKDTQDIARNPELALDPKIAADIMFLGMSEGWFTGKRLYDYINTGSCDFLKARRIINGSDKAQLIASYAEEFLKALEASVSSGFPAFSLLSVIISLFTRKPK